MGQGARIAAALLLTGLLGARPQQQQPDVSIAIFPADNPWNWDISGFAVDLTNSGNYIASIGGSTPIREDYAGDRHCLVLHEGRKLLYETYVTRKGPWRAACGAVFNLDANHVRPDGWTSADAAGLPIFPGLIRYDEAIAGTIPHALRFTCSPTQNKHIYPARHHAGTSGVDLPPMGLRVRLK